MRWIDEIIRAVEDHPHISPVHKRVLINRIEQEPTQAELDLAVQQVDKQPRTIRPQRPEINSGNWNSHVPAP